MTTYSLNTHEMPSPWERPLLAGGIVAGACFLASMALFIGVIAPQMPPFEAEAATKSAFYARMAADPVYTWARLLIFAQLAPLALLFGGLFPVLRRAEGGSGALAGATIAAGLFGALLAPVAELVEGHLLLGLTAAGADPVIAIGFDGMTPVAFGLSGIPQFVVLAGAGLLLGSRLVPRWVAWFGYLTALTGLLGVGVMFAQPFFAFGLLSAILYKLWLIALSVSLLHQPHEVVQPMPNVQPS